MGVDDRHVYMRTMLGLRVMNEPERHECSKPDLDTYHHETRECNSLAPRLLAGHDIRSVNGKQDVPMTVNDGVHRNCKNLHKRAPHNSSRPPRSGK